MSNFWGAYQYDVLTMMSARTHFFVVGGVQMSQGKHIKIQAHYECRRHDTPAKPRVQ